MIIILFIVLPPCPFYYSAFQDTQILHIVSVCVCVCVGQGMCMGGGIEGKTPSLTVSVTLVASGSQDLV